ncbi:3-deoxy-8-phosphooctulonate synthase [Thiohalocapsa marina]|uniref:2-dehydro-3-deoxyphosphooctonate aldolase n=1 Tax=Thiohalocapsa marina TaxID=424902 RepID=A0A5M8FU94_9GAMM|nr:3-deoxy-8-phosphooctulonate synthase [Thiohalocapsa marina]KAA6187319.1 3-deoxy-8-phosphooctulonate synthase [Thiohalocapsa marina]
MKHIQITDQIRIGNDLPLVLQAGPCQIESREHALMLAREIAAIAADLGIPYIFKASFDKANRSSLGGRRGVGLAQGLEILVAVRDSVGCPVLTDVHTEAQCRPVAEVVDMLQIPAFLCRQTDFVLAVGAAAAEYGRAVNVKKGQFLAPWDMRNVVDKLESTGCNKLALVERGVTFGYGNLVVDPRSLYEMAKTGYPVVMDATHAVQMPGALGNASGGKREYVPVIARAAVGVGIGALFLEVHDDPDNAASDGPNSVRLDQLPALLRTLKAIDRAAKGH